MNAIDIKKELHEYIEDADDRLLKLIYGMVLADKQSYDIPDWHKDVLNERLEQYEQNPESAISWEELKAKIEKMR
jgi:putative addiction module component (TIGR02574 family)